MTTLGLRSALIFYLLRSTRASRQVRDGHCRCGLRVELLPELNPASLRYGASSTRLLKNLWLPVSRATEFHECVGMGARPSARGVETELARLLAVPPIFFQFL